MYDVCLITGSVRLITAAMMRLVTGVVCLLTWALRLTWYITMTRAMGLITGGAVPYGRGDAPYSGGAVPYSRGDAPYNGNGTPYNEVRPPYNGGDVPCSGGDAPYLGALRLVITATKTKPKTKN